jgi:hypothetical protein
VLTASQQLFGWGLLHLTNSSSSCGSEVQQQQQQIEQMSQRRQMSKLQNQVQQIGRDTTGRQVDESIRATGHRATYMNYSHYYQ